MNHNRSQRGMSLVSLAFLLFVMTFFVMIFLKVFPSYMTNMTIESVLGSIVEESASGGESRSKGALREHILTRLDFNNVDRITAEDIVIKQNGNVYEVNIDYVDQAHMVSNIDLLITFENHVEVPR